MCLLFLFVYFSAFFVRGFSDLIIKFFFLSVCVYLFTVFLIYICDILAVIF